MLTQPEFTERFDMLHQIDPCRSTACLGKLPEACDYGNTAKDRASRVPLFGEPCDIALQRFCNPRGAETVDCVGSDKVAFQHNNLHSVKG